MTLDVGAVVQGTACRVLHVESEGDLIEDQLHVADLLQPVASVEIDSRRVLPDSLFIALPGERTDGHAFLADVFAAGARGALVRDSTDRELLRQVLAGGAFRYAFVTPDPLPALQALARFWRERHSANVVGITGSIGKTTTKEIVASVLAARGPVLKSAANLNTEIGLPLMLLRLEERHRTAVLEMGMYAAGDITLLAEIAGPTVGIVTNVEPIHLERMGSIERIARAKSELVAALPPEGLAILNGDNSWTRAMARASGVARTVLVGLSVDCDFRATEVRSHGLEGISFRLHAPDAELPMRTRIPGTHTVHALLAAAAAARELGLEWDAIGLALETAEMAERQRVLPAGEDVVVIDDSYNAAPLSMRAALDLLGAFAGEKVAVLGDMLELGPGEEEAHRQVGIWAASVADWLVVRGPRAAWIADAAARHGIPRARIITASSNSDAADAVRAITSTAIPTPAGTPTISPTGGNEPVFGGSRRNPSEPRWAVLVKGSRGMRMEEIVESLRGIA